MWQALSLLSSSPSSSSWISRSVLSLWTARKTSWRYFFRRLIKHNRFYICSVFHFDWWLSWSTSWTNIKPAWKFTVVLTMFIIEKLAIKNLALGFSCNGSNVVVTTTPHLLYSLALISFHSVCLSVTERLWVSFGPDLGGHSDGNVFFFGSAMVCGCHCHFNRPHRFTKDGKWIQCSWRAASVPGCEVRQAEQPYL